MTRKNFQCDKDRFLRPIKKSTLEKESCEKLMLRMNCYGDLIKKRKNNKIRYEAIDIFSTDPKDEPMAESFRELYILLGKRVCPTITKDQLITNLHNEFPNHSFRFQQRTVKIPQSFTDNELSRLQQKIRSLSINNYNIKFNKRLNQYYISYNRKIEPEKE